MDQALLERTCRLAELELTEGERASTLCDLEKMVECFEVISELDVEGVPPLYGVLESGLGTADAEQRASLGLGALNRVREDEPQETPCPEKLLANVPVRSDEGLIIVPKTFS